MDLSPFKSGSMSSSPPGCWRAGWENRCHSIHNVKMMPSSTQMTAVKIIQTSIFYDTKLMYTIKTINMDMWKVRKITWTESWCLRVAEFTRHCRWKATKRLNEASWLAEQSRRRWREFRSGVWLEGGGTWESTWKGIGRKRKLTDVYVRLQDVDVSVP